MRTRRLAALGATVALLAALAPGARAATRAGGPTGEPVAAIDPGAGWVDGCGDRSGGTGPDARRLYLVAQQGGDVELSVVLCGGADPVAGLGPDDGYAWRTQSPPDRPDRIRQIDVVSDGSGGLTITVQQDLDGTLAPLSGANPRWRLDGSGPVPRLVVLVDAGAVLAPRCGSDACLAVSFAVTDAAGTHIDPTPDDDPATPGGQAWDPTLLLWPSQCGLSTGAHAAARADRRLLVDVEPGAAAHVARAIRARGHAAGTHAGAVMVADVPDTALAALRAIPGVRAVRRPAHRAHTLVPSDPEYGGESNPRQWYLPAIGMPAAWDVTTGSATVRLGVIDDGIDAAREDLVGRVAAGYDAVVRPGVTPADGRALPAGARSDLGGHGTAVAALAAATGGTGGGATGMAGVDWHAALVPLRIWSHSQCFDELAYLRGLEWAAGADLDVLNMSLAGSEPIDAIAGLASEADAIQALADGGTVVVAATGNVPGVAQSYPAGLPDVIGVSATGSDGAVATYASTGRFVDLSAPGGTGPTIASGILTASDVTVDGSEFAPLFGTSFATPLVAGAATLYRALHPDASVAAVVRALLAGARDRGHAGADDAHGFGALDVAASLAATPARLDRVSGDDRYDTAAEAAAWAAPDPARVRVVVLVAGDGYPDALAGAPYAARLHAPILLARAHELPAATSNRLAALAPTDVVLVGGTGTLGPEVEAALAALGYPAASSCAAALADSQPSACRVAGGGRYETAAAVAGAGWPAAEVVYVASGENFPDALTGGALAAAAGAPLLLTTTAALATPTRDALARLRPSLVVLLGGTGSVSAGVEGEIVAMPEVARVVRAHGQDRYATALAALCPDSAACVDQTRHVVLTSGADYPDALAGSATAALLRAPLVLVDPLDAGRMSVRDALAALAPEHALLLGGTGTVPEPVAAAARGQISP